MECRIDGGPEWTAENVRSLEITPNQKITVVSDLEPTFRPVPEPSQRIFPRAASADSSVFRIVRTHDRQEENGSGFHIMPQRSPQPETPFPSSAPDTEEQRQSEQVRQEAVETRTTELETLSRDAKAPDSDLKSLETQTEELNRLKEIRSIDCQQARQELDALRTRYQDDDKSLALLPENASPLLQNSTLKKVMNRIGEELDAAEQQIGRIIRWRESVNGAIQRTILEGNGLIDYNSELKAINE